jgi:cell cycle checkpoint control protein RAD9A
VALERKDFDDFNVQEGLHIGIVVKDFRAIISHAETMRTQITAKYSRGNRPMQISYESNGILAEYTLMTRGYSSSVPNESTASTPAKDLPVRPVLRPSNNDRAPSIPATTQSVPAMPPPNAITSIRDAAPEPSVTRPTLRNTPPAPSASINPDSLFIPADDDQQWDEPNYEEEPDIVTWNAPDPSFTDSGRRIRDSEPTSFRSVGGQQSEFREFPPTQRLSQVKGLFD